MKNIIFILILISSIVRAETYYSDDFEGTAPNSTPDKFFWLGNIFSYGRVSSAVAKSGSKSMIFDYPAGWNTSIEERFELGSPTREIYVSFWWRVPTNFTHYSNRPSIGSNSKLLSIWMDGYSYQGMGPTVVWVFWGSEDIPLSSDLAVHYNPGAMPGNSENTSVTSESKQLQPFITVPQDRGRWMHIVCYAKASTARGSNDGVIETYRKWEGETAYTRLHRVDDADMPSPANGPNGWKKGYLMGWSNPGYDDPTNFYIDDMYIGNTFPTVVLGPVLPSPPSNFRIH